MSDERITFRKIIIEVVEDIDPVVRDKFIKELTEALEKLLKTKVKEFSIEYEEE